MLFKVPDYLNRDRPFSFVYKGYVVSNTDEKKLGRIKVKIERVLEGSISNLPYCFPLSIGAGRPDLSSFSVPEVDSQVAVIFPYGDIYFPVYIGYWQNENTHQTLFDEDYPNTIGSITSEISWIRINKTQNYVELFHVSGTLLRVDKDGNIDLKSPKDLSISVAGKLDLKVVDDFTLRAKNINFSAETDIGIVAGGNIGEVCSSHGIKASGTQGIQASTISHEASKLDHNSGIVFGTADSIKSKVNSAVTALNTAIAEIDSKIEELNTLKSEIESSRDSIKADFTSKSNNLIGDR